MTYVRSVSGVPDGQVVPSPPIRQAPDLRSPLIAGGITSPAAAPNPRWTIGMSQCNLGEPWRVQMNADIRKAAESHPELRVIFKDAQNDNLRQAAQVEEFVRARVNLIIISPKEAAPLTKPVGDGIHERDSRHRARPPRARRRVHLFHRRRQQEDRQGRREMDRQEARRARAKSSN